MMRVTMLHRFGVRLQIAQVPADRCHSFSSLHINNKNKVITKTLAHLTIICAPYAMDCVDRECSLLSNVLLVLNVNMKSIRVKGR